MILIDTSAWINFFKDRKPLSSKVDECLLNNQATLCGPIITELRRGFKSVLERKKVLNLMTGCRFLEPPQFLWEEAGDLGFYLSRKGKTVKTLDLLIATYALTYKTSLLTSDKDFQIIKQAGFSLDLEIF